MDDASWNELRRRLERASSVVGPVAISVQKITIKPGYDLNSAEKCFNVMPSMAEIAASQMAACITDKQKVFIIKDRFDERKG